LSNCIMKFLWKMALFHLNYHLNNFFSLCVLF